jgi:hypothetical protein
VAARRQYFSPARTGGGSFVSGRPTAPPAAGGGTLPPVTDELICSAKGCRQLATTALDWNNPKIHPPERRKTWLACADHTPTLTAYLDARGFLRETRPL